MIKNRIPSSPSLPYSKMGIILILLMLLGLGNACTNQVVPIRKKNQIISISLSGKSKHPFYHKQPVLGISHVLPKAENLLAKNPEPKFNGTPWIPWVDSWQPIGHGVNYCEVDSPRGEHVFIGYAGYIVYQDWTNKWLYAMFEKKLCTMGVRHIYAVKGPISGGYHTQELNNPGLLDHLVMHAYPEDQIIMVACHSSGCYVAHDLFKRILQLKPDIRARFKNKIYYFNLDGTIGDGSLFGFTEAMAQFLHHTYGVYTYDATTQQYSQQHYSMVELGNRYAGKTSPLQITIPYTGCYYGVIHCMHHTVINRYPHNSAGISAADYHTMNEAHPVNTEYLDVLDPVLIEKTN